MPFLSDYACKVCLLHLSKISLYEFRFLLPPSSRHLGIAHFLLKIKEKIKIVFIVSIQHPTRSSK
jgi:hypothetical protein